MTELKATNTGKKVESAPAVQAVPAVPTRDMASEEITGIYTALDISASLTEHLSKAVALGKTSESRLFEYRAKITADRGANRMLDEMLKAHPEYITQEEEKITGESRKAVQEAYKALSEQLSTMGVLLMNANEKYGIPVQVSVRASQVGRKPSNAITDHNKALLESKLKIRGYTNITFAPMGEPSNQWYQCTATAPDGRTRTGRYSGQIDTDWF